MKKLEAGRVESRYKDSATQVMRKSLNIEQIGQLFPDPYHVITTVRTLSFFNQREATIFTELTFPEFHFETEAEVDFP